MKKHDGKALNTVALIIVVKFGKFIITAKSVVYVKSSGKVKSK